MTRSRRTAVFLAFTLAAGQALAGERADLETNVLKLEKEWDDAIVAKDRAVLERILSEDFLLISEDGATASKAELIEAISSPDLKIAPFQTEDVQVRLYGDVAVVTGRFFQTGSYKGTRFESTCRYTDVYVRRDGRWRAVSAQATPIAKAPSG